MKNVNRPTLITLMRIDACRTGCTITLNESTGKVCLRAVSGRQSSIMEWMSVRDACTVLHMTLGKRCNNYVALNGDPPCTWPK